MLILLAGGEDSPTSGATVRRSAASMHGRQAQTWPLMLPLGCACCGPSLQGLTSMDGAELADSIMTFAEQRPPNAAAFR